MIKGRKKLISSIVIENLHSFEKKSKYYIDEYDLFGCTVERELFENDGKIRYIHLYHSSSKEAIELQQINENLQSMKHEMDRIIGSCATVPKSYAEYFDLNYKSVEVLDVEAGKQVSETKKIFISYSEKESVVEYQRQLCGYFAIVTSQKLSAKEALLLYKSRDASEKLFRGDKSYLGDKSMRAYSSESTEAKIFVEFIALIIRTRIYVKLHDYEISQVKKHNFMSVPAAIRELEKIIMIYLPDKMYHKAHAVTKTQKTILSVFDIKDDFISDSAHEIADTLKQLESKKTKNE